MTLASKLSSPNADAPDRLQADWLELVAYLGDDHHASLDVLVSQFDIEADQDYDNSADDDEFVDDTKAIVIAEIERRQKILGACYPFAMSDDGAQLELCFDGGVGQSTYLFSLIMAHARGSALVNADLQPSNPILLRGRDIFQVCATLGASGKTGGAAFSIGWPRTDKSGFLDKLKEIWAIFGDGQPHDIAPEHAPAQIKDGGIDVMTWFPETDGQPGHGFLLGQVASGNDWKAKSILPDLKQFMALWFHTQPVSQSHGFLIIPFLLDEHMMKNQTPRHGYILDRGRLPHYAERAVGLAGAGIGPIERLNEAANIGLWLTDHQHDLAERWAA